MLDTDDAVVGQQLLRASLEGFELDFSDEALEAIVTKSMESGMGARRLRGITSHALHRIFFDVPSMVKAGRAIRIVVTERTIEDPADYDVSMAV
jgi:ATP-dependent Clp protease ATP-binding subunit ClpX